MTESEDLAECLCGKRQDDSAWGSRAAAPHLQDFDYFICDRRNPEHGRKESRKAANQTPCGIHAVSGCDDDADGEHEARGRRERNDVSARRVFGYKETISNSFDSRQDGGRTHRT